MLAKIGSVRLEEKGVERSVAFPETASVRAAENSDQPGDISVASWTWRWL